MLIILKQHLFEIGNLYNATQIGRVTGVEYEEVVKRGCDKVDENTLVNNISIAAAKNNANLHKLIEFSGCSLQMNH